MEPAACLLPEPLHETAVFILAYGVCNLPAAINRTTIQEHNPARILTNVLSRIDFLSHHRPGPGDLHLTAPGTPGTHFFRCDVHPFMNGVFIVE